VNQISNYETKKIITLVKPVTQYIELSVPEIIMHDSFKCYSLNARQYMRRHAWRSGVEEPNNAL